jgi:leucyl-tRNA synthetase
VVKITDYADKLIDGLKETNFIEKVKQAQINWIGKSEGAKIKFQISNDKNQSLEVFTTRPDTLFGATFMVIAPEHELVSKLESEEIKNYVANARKKSDLERTELSKDKTGVFSGLYAINPVNNKEIPIWISDFVLANYGTGAIMSVPAHDERDFDFAKKFGLEINQVLAPLFKTTEGKDAVREDKPTIKRNTVYVLVKHWGENKYLCLDWKNFGWHSGIIGGVNESEEWLDAAKREVLEETGYKNIKLEKEIGVEVHNNFFAGHKDENRYAIGRGYVLKIENEDKAETNDEDTKNHDLVWIDGNKMEKFLNLPVFNFYWDLLKKGKDCFTGDGILINSDFLNGLSKKEAFEKMIKWLEEKKIGERAASYHLRDWIFSRQHYWGEPIPMIKCPKCGWVPVPEDQLPVVLPEVEAYEPTDDGQSPLSKMDSFVKVKCPTCGGEAQRETDTMPNWAGSDWYFLRYIDPYNDAEIASMDLMKYWSPVDVYIGGDEHNVLHLLYSRFIYKFLWETGVVPKEYPEPYIKRLSHGVILGPDNQRMSKSKGNVIVPETVADKYGVDVVRMYLMFMGPFDSTMAWNEKTLMGVKRFLDRFEKYIKSQTQDNAASSKEVSLIINKLIDGVTGDLNNFKYNTAVAKMMEALNGLTNVKFQISKEDIKTLVRLLAPFAPYLSEELYSLFEKNSVHASEWPKAEAKYLSDEEVVIAIAINGKVRSEIKIDSEKQNEKEEILKLAKQDKKVIKWIGDKRIAKEIYVVGKMINFVILN